jgi:hypothetical protein
MRLLPLLALFTAACSIAPEPAETRESAIVAREADACAVLDEAACNAAERCEATYRSGPMTDTGTESFLFDACVSRSR